MRYLYDRGEEIPLECDSVLYRHPFLADGKEATRGKAGERLAPPPAGHYLIREIPAPGEDRLRYLGVIGENTTVVQITVGAFTAEPFGEVVHACRVPVNYYIEPGQAADTAFRTCEQDFGDAVYPHVMANHMGEIDPRFARNDPNWESLGVPEIVERLRALDAFWQKRGFAPLHGIASYTPSNSLVAALKELGWNVLHSVVPEQNWSDGRWAINHWGMPNQPFYVASDDFRKPCARSGRNLLAMGMNSYHLYMPHVTRWGDNVLSPSHFLRWHRTVESGPEPVRFQAFLDDYLAARSTGTEPFFLIAGFEFGRTFGVRSMTRHNRRGLELLVEAARERNLVFATGRDVALYFEARRSGCPENVFTQRDYLAGTRIMDKPVDSGPSIGMEMTEYKAVFAHLSPLPFYHYDYRERWNFRAGDADAPHDYAGEDRERVRFENGAVTVREPLPRAVPVAFWDHELVSPVPFRTFVPAKLDDGRLHTVVELPAGWRGEWKPELRRVSAPTELESEGPLRIRKIGGFCYVYPEFPVTRPFAIRWKTPRPCSAASPGRFYGELPAGTELSLEFDARRLWHRFGGVEPGELRPDAAAREILEREAAESARFFREAERQLPEEQNAFDAAFSALLPPGEETVLDIDCFGDCVFGEKSRAKPFDRVVRRKRGLSAEELSDGGISLGHGKSFWVHPRKLHFEISELDALRGKFTVTLYNDNPHRYRLEVKSGGRLLAAAPSWDCGREKTLRLVLDAGDFPEGTADFFLYSDQIGVLDDWFRDGGFCATLERLAVTVPKSDLH